VDVEGKLIESVATRASTGKVHMIRNLSHRRYRYEKYIDRMPIFGEKRINDDEKPSHHVTKSSLFSRSRFRNPWSTWHEPTFGEVLSMLLGTLRSRETSFSAKLIDFPYPTEEDLRKAFPINDPDLLKISNPDTNRIQATWIGHSTVLVQMGGYNILTDPIFESSCSPVGRPKRIVEPAIELENLPHIDAVVISHGHFDHLCNKSVRALHRKFHDILFMVPLGQKEWFVSRGMKNVVELDWWDEFGFEELKFTFTPAQHWSMRRAGWDRNRALWGSWLIESKGKSFWFAGDTGYSEELFQSIAEKLNKPINVAAIPIGAYEPRWFMAPQHVCPEEALMIHQVLNAEISIAIHHGTFPLTSEPMDEPSIRLKAALHQTGLDEDVFQVVRHGSMVMSK